MNQKTPVTISSPLSVGTVVLFEQDSEPHLALVVGLKKDKYQLFSERARTLELSGNRICSFDIRAQTSLVSTEQQQFLVSLKTECMSAAKSINLEELWQTVCDSNQAFDSDELAGLCFPVTSAQQKLSVKLLLLTDRAYFKRDKDKFVPRPAHIVEELKKAQEVQAEKKRLRLGLAEYFRSSAELLKDLPAGLGPLIELLKRYAVGMELSASEEREAKEITELALDIENKDNHRVAPFAAYSILERLKIFGPRTNPAWEKSALSGAAVLEAGDLDSERKVDLDINRQDFTALDAFTIDDISTRDMDDALTLESTEYGYRLGVHISDVASELPIDSKMDRTTAQRLSSIYLPDLTVHMLPEQLSLEKLSLVQSEKRRVLSLMLELDRSYSIIKTSIVPAWIIVKRRWTYDQVDDLLETANSEFSTFYEIASAFEASRMENGAMHVQKTEIAVSVDIDGVVSLKEIDEQSPARAIVAEMAVLFNRVAAEYCRDNKIPALFRGQPEPDPEYVDEPKPAGGRALDFFIRVRLKRSESSLVAQSHAGLGLKAYLQVTSPIRRYADLVNQRQLLAHLRSEPSPYNVADLEKIVLDCEEGISKINKVAKESKRFWLLRYLEQRIVKGSGPEAKQITGEVVRTTGKHPLVELDEVFFATFVKSNRKLSVGENVKLVITGVDAREDYLRLEVQGGPAVPLPNQSFS